MEKIAVLWPNALNDIEEIGGKQDILLFENIGVRNAAEAALQAERQGAKAIICTKGIEVEVRKVVSLPTHVVAAAYIDLLESLRMLEEKYHIVNKHIAVLLHTNNQVRIERLIPYVNNRIELITFTEVSDIVKAIAYIRNHDFDALLSGPTGMDLSNELPIPKYSLYYSKESINEAAAQMRIILSLSKKQILEGQKLRTVINVSPNAMIVLDAQGKIEICNERAYRVFQRSLQDLIGASLSEILGDREWELTENQEDIPESMLVQIGKETYFFTWQPIIQDGVRIGTVGTFEDAEKIQRMENKYRALQTKGLTAKYHFKDIISNSKIMQERIGLAKAYAHTDLTVLIEGETGTGKELFAQSIHNASSRRYGPFVAFNCAALSESLLESELMGYEAGAFTGAKRNGKIGLLELAHNGTIFLDEINQLPVYLQSKLLRVIQERSVLRVGGERIVPIDIRIIAAANEKLIELVREKKFRNDLYYRLNILNLTLPPLRERKDDIPALVEFFAGSGARDMKEMGAFIERLADYEWPGNIRELQNYILRYMALHSQGIYDAASFMADKADAAGRDEREDMRIPLTTLREMERIIAKKAVAACGGNQTKAAKLLGISRNSLSARLKT